MKFDRYDPTGVFDEMFEAQGRPRPGCSLLAGKIDSLTTGELVRRQQAAERALLAMGITFNVYGDGAGHDKIMPFDLVPRIVPAGEWSRIERGLAQRIVALNAFLCDVYGAQKIVKDGVVPRELIESGTSFQKACIGLRPPRDVWCHVTGTDLVRDQDGEFYVLEDNLRCPSGVSYVLENRRVMKRTFPHLFAESRVRPVDEYPGRLLAMLQGLAKNPHGDAPVVVVLTPGKANSAYFEHSFLAQQMGVELVEGQDLTVKDSAVWMRTTKGLRRVDVIYRRIDDTFLDPKAFRPDSLLGVPGIYDVYRNGGVALANAPGTGIADDKVIYAHVPKMIRYYLGEDAILPNVPTYVCADEKDRAYVLDHLDTLVVKAANESGGYGMLIGPCASSEERAKFGDHVRRNPRNYIAQPTLSLSQVPVIVGDHFEGRHVDLRPYILYGGDDVFVLPGGLTRVALRKGSLVVNSSQGGGSKDTWVLHEPRVSMTEPVTSPSLPGTPSLWQWQVPAQADGHSQNQAQDQSQSQTQSQSQSQPAPPAQARVVDPVRGGGRC